ncbi:hypothetical protein D9M71_37790 [compost metagenome]
MIVQVVGVVDVGVEQVNAFVPLQVVKAVIGQWLFLVTIGLVAKVHVFVFQGLVVPALHAQHAAHVAVVQVQFGEELADGRKPVAAIVVEVAAIGIGTAQAVGLADHLSVEPTVQLVITPFGAPAATNGKCGVEAPRPTALGIKIECLGIAGAHSENSKHDCLTKLMPDKACLWRTYSYHCSHS